MRDPARLKIDGRVHVVEVDPSPFRIVEVFTIRGSWRVTKHIIPRCDGSGEKFNVGQHIYQWVI